MDKIGYAKIAAELRRMIQTGALAPGDSLPSLAEVREKYDVSMTTANRAFQLLKAEGMTYAKPGVGTVVAARPRAITTGAARLDRLEATGRTLAHDETSTDHVAMMRSCNDDDIIEQLGIEPHDEIVLRRRTFRRNDVPTCVGLSFIHPRALGSVPELLQNGPLRPFWQERYTERTGKEVVRSPERRTARLASSSELAALEVAVPPNAAVAVLVLHTTFHDDEGPIEVWEDVHAPGLWQVSDQ